MMTLCEKGVFSHWCFFLFYTESVVDTCCLEVTPKHLRFFSKEMVMSMIILCATVSWIFLSVVWHDQQWAHEPTLAALHSLFWNFGFKAMPMHTSGNCHPHCCAQALWGNGCMAGVPGLHLASSGQVSEILPVNLVTLQSGFVACYK